MIRILRVLALVVACSTAGTACVPENRLDHYQITDFKEIIANPNAYAGKKVKTIGWFMYRFEDCSLWRNAEEIDIAHLESAIWVNGQNVTCLSGDATLHPRSGMAMVEGTVSVGHVGHLGLFNVAIIQANVTFQK